MDAVYDTLTLYQLTERPLSGIDRIVPPDETDISDIDITDNYSVLP